MEKRSFTRTVETAISREDATAERSARTTRTAEMATLSADTIPTGARAEDITATTADPARVSFAFDHHFERADFFSARFFCAN